MNDANEQLEADLVEVGEHLGLPPLSLAALPLQQPGGAGSHSARVHRQPHTWQKRFMTGIVIPIPLYTPGQEVPCSPCKCIHSNSSHPDASHVGAKVVGEATYWVFFIYIYISFYFLLVYFLVLFYESGCRIHLWCPGKRAAPGRRCASDLPNLAPASCESSSSS